MAIGVSLGSVATGRTATSSKPFFSSTRRDVALAPRCGGQHPAPGWWRRASATSAATSMVPAPCPVQARPPMASRCRSHRRVYPWPWLRRGSPPTGTTGTSRSGYVPGDHEHDRWPGAGPADALPVLGDLRLGGGVRCPAARHVRQAKPGLNGEEVFFGHRAQWQHPVTLRRRMAPPLLVHHRRADADGARYGR